MQLEREKLKLRIPFFFRKGFYLSACILFLTIPSLSAQSKIASFRALSRPEKYWVVAHPFIAQKAYRITQEALAFTKEESTDKRLDGIGNGGQLDAFRHCFWMARLSQEIGVRKALKLGRAHERGNYLDFKRGKLEEGALPDSVSSVMDLFNNRIGAALGKHYEAENPGQLKERVIDLILHGKLFILSMDERGNFLDAKRQVLDLSQWKKKWGVPKVLVPSGIM
jgi:hypothetical protein